MGRIGYLILGIFIGIVIGALLGFLALGAEAEYYKQIASSLCSQNNEISDLVNTCVAKLGITERLSQLNCYEILK